MTRWTEEVAGTMFDDDPRAFRVFVTQAFFEWAKGPGNVGSDEELLFAPRAGIMFCDYIRQRLTDLGESKAWTDAIILKALTETRKRGERTAIQVVRPSAKLRRKRSS